ETVREYASERLSASGDSGARHRRHAEWYLALAEEAEPELSGERQSSWFATLEAEHDNLRAALAHLGAIHASELKLRLTIALTRFCYVRGYLSEGRRWLDEAHGGEGDQPAELARRASAGTAALG